MADKSYGKYNSLLKLVDLGDGTHAPAVVPTTADSGPVTAEAPLPTAQVATTLVKKGYQQITTLSAAVGLTVPSGATLAIIQAEAQNVRWRDDATNPTASVGMVLAAGSELIYDSGLADIKFIEATSGAKLNISYYAKA